MDDSLKVFTTPKGIQLQGVWLGSRHPRNLFIFVHGLGGSLFSRAPLLSLLASSKDAVFTFSNRGSGTINYFKRTKGKKKDYIKAGVAHEKFSDCIDDLDGVLSEARKAKPDNIFLVGHSTGCQKIIYYLAKKPRARVKGAILLAPISDYSGRFLSLGESGYKKALSKAKSLFNSGRPHELLPEKIWPETMDAQRFLSLYTEDSQEEIFTYASSKKAKTLLKVKKPVLSLLAENDEFADRPAKELASWFESNLISKKSEVRIIRNTGHSFSDKEKGINRIIKNWYSSLF